MELRKIVFFILCVTLFALPVTANAQFEISKDNETWKPINSSAFEGTLDQLNSIGLAQVLNPLTEYHIRGKNETTDWTYKTFTTDGERQMVGIILSFMAAILVFGLFGFFSKGPIVKIASYGVAFLQLTSMMFVIYINELNQSLASFLKINFTVILLLVGTIAAVTMIVQLISIMSPNKDHTSEMKWRDR